MFTSITLKNYSSQELAEEIVNYLKNKKVRKVKIVIIEELKDKVEKVYTSDQFESLRSKIKEAIEDEGINFFLEIPEIKTSFEEFSYGVEANSYENDFKNIFFKYE